LIQYSKDVPFYWSSALDLDVWRCSSDILEL